MTKRMQCVRVPKHLLVLLLVGPAAALAQTTPPSANEGALAEIIVTAQRRAENVQNVPISVTQVSGAQLAAERITQPVDLSRAVAGLITNNATSDSTPIFAIRGIGLDDWNINNSSGVGLYVDDVFQSYPAFLIAPFYDVDRVEVLKGPQGTLYGRNTTGGAISVVSAAPPSTFGGYIVAGYGRYQTTDLEGAIGGPLTDSIRGRLSGTLTDQGEGFQTDVDTGRKYGRIRRGALRGQIAATLASNVSLLLNVHHAEDRSIPESPQSPNAEQEINGLFGTVLGSLTYFGTPIQGLLNGTGDPSQVRVGPISPYIRSDSDGASARLTIDGEATQITSITAFDSNSTTGLDNYDGLPVSEFDFYRDFKAQQFSQEVRVASSTHDRVDWVAGGIYATDQLIDRDKGDSTFVILGTYAPGPVILAANYKQATTSYGLFANTQTHLTSLLDFILGVRYSHDQRSFRGTTNDVSGLYLGGAPGAPTASLDDSHTSQNLSYRIGLSYHFIREVMGYASVATGYKAGGYYGATAPSQAAWGYIPPERTNTAEIGIKSRFAQDRIQINGAVFHTAYVDRQSSVTAITPQGSYFASIGTIPKSKIDGAELEFATDLGAGFDLRTSGTYLASSVENTISDLRGLSLAAPIPEGSALAHAPKWSTNFSIGYRPDIRIAGYKVDVRADYSWTAAETAYLGDPQAAYGPNRTLGLHADLASDRNGLTWTAWATNVTDARDITYSFTDILGERVVYYQKPRAYGVRVRYEF